MNQYFRPTNILAYNLRRFEMFIGLTNEDFVKLLYEFEDLIFS
jgi:hypothetical protein